MLITLTSGRTLPFDSEIAALYNHSLKVFSVNAVVSVLVVIVVCKTMPEIHFRSMEAPQNQRDFTKQFGNRDFI
jgi:hypothetical protein